MESGTRLGPYEIIEQLGAGGMGEVYRARDARLERDIAIKVLPAHFAADEERLARFAREAKLLAQLNHANIATIHGFEEFQGVNFIAMELVEGQSLAERIADAAVEVDEALEIAEQIALALEAAHEAGVVHRDLKPANVVVTPDGQAKVLDFGLAKAYSAGSSSSGFSEQQSQSPTLVAATGTGLIMGTAAYMSPEQAKGKSLDKRTDIWSFGVLLYEMLTARSAFRGEDVSETLAAILRDEPDWSLLPAAVPPAVERLLHRCLKKDPRQRLRDIGDARNEIVDARTEPAESVAIAGQARRNLPAFLPWSLALLMAATSLALFLGRPDSPGPPALVSRLAIDLPWHAVANWTDFTVALSPRGTHFVYNGRVDNQVDLYARSLDSLEATPLADAREAGAFFFSPDGEWIGVLERQKLRKISLRGGRNQELARLEGLDVSGASWGADGTILLGTSAGLYRVPESGGNPERVAISGAGDEGAAYLDPSHLPGGAAVIVSTDQGTEEGQLGVVDLATGAFEPLPIHGFDAVFAPTGHLVYWWQSALYAVRFDLGGLRTVGDPVLVAEGVREGPYLSENGTLLYVPERGESNARLVWVDRTGRPTPISGERQDYSHLDLSAGGRSALLNLGGDVYVLDVARGSRRLLKSDALYQIWSAGDVQATYASLAQERRLAWVLADGSSAEAHLWDTGDQRSANGRVPTSWNENTGDLAFFDDDIWVVPTEGEPVPFVNTTAHERSGRFSPDGSLMAYVSDETGQYQVYVVPFPGPGPKVAVSIAGGMSPIWSHDGSEIFFRRGGKLLAASVIRTPELRVGQPVELFDGPYTLDLMGHQRYDVGPDGQFLMVENSDDFRIVVVLNWFEELKRLLPAR